MKKRLLQRILSLAICAAMVAGSMTGCGDGKEKDPVDKQEQEDNSQDEQDEQKQEESSVDKAFAPFDETVTVKCVMGYSESSKPGLLPSTCYWNDLTKEYLNVELDWMWEVPDSQYETKLSVTLSSGEYPDVLKCDYDTYSYLLESGALKDLSGVWEEYASEALKTAFASDSGTAAFERVTEDGKLMAIPYASDPVATMVCNYYRTDWLENLGMEVPTNLDELTEVIKAFRDQDPDGNGEKDTYAMGLSSEIFSASGGSLQSFFNTFSSYPTAWIEKDGEIVHGAIQDETKEALDWMRGLYSEGYIDPEFATYDEEQKQAKVADSKTGLLSGSWSTPDLTTFMNSMNNNKEATWGVGTVVGKNEGDVGHSIVDENTTSAYNVVLASASDEAAIAMIKMLNMFFDYNFYYEEGTSDWPWWNRVNATDSDEYKAIDEKWYSWWLPVNIWDPAGTYNQYAAATELYETGYFSPYISLGNEEANRRWKDWGVNIRKDRSEMQTQEEDDAWCLSYVRCLTRITTEELGPCSTEILYNQKQAGDCVYKVFYGTETKTGVEIASTLNDYVVEYICNYIMGNESEDSWDEFVDGWLSMGGETWTEEVNEAYYALH